MHLDPFYPQTLREEELKNKVAADWFGPFDCTRIIGNVDFCVDIPATELALGYESEPALWAEAKAGTKKDIVASFVQLILTIGGEHTADRNLPPHFLGAFDAEKIAFIPYSAVLEVLGKNDFNWTVAPSDHESKEFKELYALVEGTIRREKMLFRFTEDEVELRRFIKSNFKSGRRDISKILINKNNFTHIYRQWRESVMPFINANWDILKRKYAIYDRDFYLAEMNIDDNGTSDIADDRIASEFYITFDAKTQSPYTVHRKNEDELWRYYHAQPDANPNASYYDIRLHFQGVTTDAHGKSKMNPTSEDATYNKLLANLRAAMKSLAANIEPKVYEYGFLLR